MSWRFRKTFKVLPGVKLNLSRHGLSATFGVAPFSLNVGPRGVYSTPVPAFGTESVLTLPLQQPPTFADCLLINNNYRHSCQHIHQRHLRLKFTAPALNHSAARVWSNYGGS